MSWLTVSDLSCRNMSKWGSKAPQCALCLKSDWCLSDFWSVRGTWLCLLPLLRNTANNFNICRETNGKAQAVWRPDRARANLQVRDACLEEKAKARSEVRAQSAREPPWQFTVTLPASTLTHFTSCHCANILYNEALLWIFQAFLLSARPQPHTASF